MKRAVLLFLLLFSSLSFAAVSEAVSDSSTYLYRPDLDPDQSYLRVRPYYWFQSTVRVGVNSASQVVDAAGGTYTDLGDGATICEGQVNVYGTSLGEWAHNNNLYAYSTWVWDGSCTPNSYSTVAEHNVNWNDGYYNTFRDIWSGRCNSGMSECWGHEGGLYGERVNTYELNDETSWDTRRGDMNSICKGQQYLSYNRVGGFSLVTPLGNGEPSATVSATGIGVVSGKYSFKNNLDVQGCSHVIRQYDESCDLMEYAYTFTTIDGTPEYSKAVTSAIEINVISEDDVGVLPPTIQSVSLQGYTMTAGHYILEPGSDIPVTITVRVPARTSAYERYLTFELDQAQALSPFSFSPTSGLNQCDFMFPLYNGGFFGNSAYTVPVQGTLHVPDSLPEDGGDIQFRVHWQACSGQPNCGATGISGWTAPFEVPYIPPGDDDTPPPDLTCSLEPVALIGANASATELTEGQGVEQWELTITNIGDNPLVLSGNSSHQLAQYLCLQGIFNAYEEDSLGDQVFVYDPGLSFYILTTSNLNLTHGESITKTFDGAVYCGEEEGAIGAWALINMAGLLYSQCMEYEIEEEDWDNNWCVWEIPCVNETGPEIPDDENCTITPTSRPGVVGWEYDFELTCGDDDGECVGPVDWTITTGGSIEGNQTGATAEVLSDDNDLLITATVGDPEDAVCHAQIYFGDNPGGNNCYIEITPQTGHPGSFHYFDLTCSGEGVEDGLCDNADWDITQGEVFVADSEGDPFHWQGTLNQFAINTTIIVEALVDFGEYGTAICEGEIIVPDVPCIEYV